MREAEVIEKIEKLVRCASEPIKMDQYRTAFRDEGGNITSILAAEKPHTTIAFSIQSLVDETCIHDFTVDEQDSDADLHGGECIHYSRRGIRGFRSPERRDSVTMLLTKSKAFAKLEAWDAKPELLKQDALFHQLKTTFYGCTDENVSSIIRSIKWTFGDTGNSTVDRGKVSINKSLIQEMSGADDFAKIEYIDFEVVVFQELPNTKAKIRCYLRPVPQDQLFELTPCGGMIEAAYRTAENAMAMQLEAAIGERPIPIFHAAANADNTDAVKLI